MFTQNTVTKTLRNEVSIAGLNNEIHINESILVKIEDNCYTINGSKGFADCFRFDQWTILEVTEESDIVIAMEFADQWVLEIYRSGYAGAFSNYGPRDQQGWAYYKIPKDIANSLAEFVTSNGKPCVLGDGDWGLTSFYH